MTWCRLNVYFGLINVLDKNRMFVQVFTALTSPNYAKNSNMLELDLYSGRENVPPSLAGLKLVFYVISLTFCDYMRYFYLFPTNKE